MILYLCAMNFLIVGLGNIGSEYADTRHNIGFMVADELARQAGTTWSLLRHAYYTEFKLRGHNVYVIKPTTYMNLSGKAVNYWMQQLKVPLSNVLVIVDDLAIHFDSLLTKHNGSEASNKRLKSIQALCGRKNYPRLRVGIGNNYHKGRQVEYVLGLFDKEEQQQLPCLIEHAVKIVHSFVSIGIE